MNEKSTAPTNAFELLPEVLQKNLLTNEIKEPTAIQSKAIPAALEGDDLLAQSQTGSGKTLAFALPMIAALLEETPESRCIRALVLTPTRELTLQVAGVFEKMLKGVPLRVASIIGGASYSQQRHFLKNADIVIGTPGRIIDLNSQGTLDLSNVEVFVLDEVDQMLDIGFADDLLKIKEALPAERQTLFFSATLHPRIKKVAVNMLHKPVEIAIAADKTHASGISHGYIECRPGTEVKALMNALLYTKPTQALVFCETKLQCAQVTEELLKRGFDAGMLNSDMSQQERTHMMSRFRSGSVRFLVATNVAARGIDIQDLPLVINMSVPYNVENYVHRSGRTGRAGATGESWTFVNQRSWRAYQNIARESKMQVTKITIPGADEIWRKFAESELQSLLTGAHGQRSHAIDKHIRSVVEEMSHDDLIIAVRTAIVKSLERLSVFDLSEFAAERPLGEQRRPERREHGGRGDRFGRKFDRPEGKKKPWKEKGGDGKKRDWKKDSPKDGKPKDWKGQKPNKDWKKKEKNKSAHTPNKK